jgi:hypothetical protein
MAPVPDLISERQATSILSRVGVARRQGRRILAAGLAGEPLVTSAAKLYDGRAVDRLTEWPLVDHDDVDQICPRGYFIARRDGEHTLAALADGWDIAWLATTWLQIIVERDGPLPLIATVAGFVVRGADIEDVDFGVGGRATFRLTEAGSWFEHLRGRRFSTGPGRDCVVRLPGVSPTPLRYGTMLG